MKSRTRIRTQIVRAAFASGALLAAVAAAPQPAAAAGVTFVVNRNTDAADLNTADGRCDVSRKAGRQCTLRAAIQQANTSGGPNIIAFNLASSARTIAPSSPLPVVTDDGITIDGYTQNGASLNTFPSSDNAVIKVVLDGINAGNAASGLTIQADNSLIRGLDIQRFSGNGVSITGSNVTLTGNFIGTNAAGTTKRGNGVGVFVNGPNAVIGGNRADGRNLISGNVHDGISISLTVNGSGNDASVFGNFVGTNGFGDAALGNGGNGVLDHGSGTTIGAPLAIQNVISGNGGSGIYLWDATSTTILGAYIGTGEDGVLAVPNEGSGILLLASGPGWIGPGNIVANNRADGVFLGNGSFGTEVFQSTITNNVDDGVSVISGPQTIHDNTISDNHGDGINVQTPTATGIDMFGNSESGNVHLGIDLRGGSQDSYGVTANDAGDADSGANNLQNFPVITSAISNRFLDKTTVGGTLSSGASQAYRIEIFSASADPSGHGEGQFSLGTVEVSTGSGGTISWSFLAEHVPPGRQITATATLLDDESTSEFSADVVASGS